MTLNPDPKPLEHARDSGDCCLDAHVWARACWCSKALVGACVLLCRLLQGALHLVSTCVHMLWRHMTCVLLCTC